jgi:transketolase
MAAADALDGEDIKARVVSMPSTDVFDAQDETYREQVLPAAVTARVVVEAGVTDTWWRYAGSCGRVIGLDRFGESAPADELFELFGFTADNVAAVAREVLAQP